MLSLNLPVFDTKINVRNGKNVIFDVIRKRYVALTPEEWVRQHFVHFLIAHKAILFYTGTLSGAYFFSST